jgi:hypothetical protein
MGRIIEFNVFKDVQRPFARHQLRAVDASAEDRSYTISSILVTATARPQDMRTFGLCAASNVAVTRHDLFAEVHEGCQECAQREVVWACRLLSRQIRNRFCIGVN